MYKIILRAFLVYPAKRDLQEMMEFLELAEKMVHLD